MRILMVLVIVALFVVAGGFVGGSMVDVPPTPEKRPQVASQPRDRDREIMEAQHAFGAGAEVMQQRQHNIMVGAGVGLVVGLAVGILVASRLSARRKA